MMEFEDVTEVEDFLKFFLPASSASILVPWCGHAALWEALYDRGWKKVTALGFPDEMMSLSVEFVALILRNMHKRPGMQFGFGNFRAFSKESFDAVVDIGWLDSLMEKAGCTKMEYIHQVKRVLRDGGRFLLFTNAESLDMSNFGYGWTVTARSIPVKTRATSVRFLIIACKEGKKECEDLSAAAVGEEKSPQQLISSDDNLLQVTSHVYGEIIVNESGNEDIIRSLFFKTTNGTREVTGSISHLNMVSGLVLRASWLSRAALLGTNVKVLVIGLESGALPLLLRKCLGFLEIKVVERDNELLKVCRSYFDFPEDELKVHITGCPDYQMSHFERCDFLFVNVDDYAYCRFADDLIVHAAQRVSRKGILVVKLGSSSLTKIVLLSRLQGVFQRFYHLEEDNLFFAVRKKKSFGEAALHKLAGLLDVEVDLSIRMKIIDSASMMKALM